LAISPQCGFAIVVDGNLITTGDQIKKPALMIETAQKYWGAV
jgi:5-methyltetrahydropteroyltriglutamate--homocysteine methyltransferase